MISKDTLQKTGIDYKKGLTYFGQDEDLYQKYLLDFAHENYTEDAFNCLKVQDVKGAFSAVHSLKSLVEYVSIPVIDEIVHEITETLRAEKTEGVEDGLMYIRTVTEEIKKTILDETK